MSAEWAEWPGNEKEKGIFLEAIAKSCECVRQDSRITEVCRSHLLLTPSKQNHQFWQHLVYERRLWNGPNSAELLAQEFDATRPENLRGVTEKLPPYRMGWNI